MPIALINIGRKRKFLVQGKEAPTITYRDMRLETVRVTCHSDRTELVLEGAFDVAHVREAYQLLDQGLRRGLPLELHTADIERVDTAGLQLLVAFYRAAHEHGLKVEWRSVGAVLRSSSTMLGIASSLELPS